MSSVSIFFNKFWYRNIFRFIEKLEEDYEEFIGILWLVFCIVDVIIVFLYN